MLVSTTGVYPARAASTAQAAPTVAPAQFAAVAHIGAHADGITGAKVCTVGHSCLSRQISSEAGGFYYPSSVAVDPRNGDIYVTDMDNQRVQRLTATGSFLAAFGWGVGHVTGKRAPPPQPSTNVCTAASTATCAAGVRGDRVEQLAYPASAAVDPGTGDVYVMSMDPGDYRIDKYTPAGRFVWRIGKHVNTMTRANLCSQKDAQGSLTACGAGGQNASDGTEHGAFDFAAGQPGNMLASGGPEDLLYVADEHRVQVFGSDGRWRRELPLATLSASRASSVTAIAVDETGNVYLAYHTTTPQLETIAQPDATVLKIDPQGEQVARFFITPRRPDAIMHLDGIAVDPQSQLAVIGVERYPASASYSRFGLVYDDSTGNLTGEFQPPSDNDGLALSRTGDLYVAATDDQQIVAYAPAPSTPLLTSPAPCNIDPGTYSDVAFNCALNRL